MDKAFDFSRFAPPTDLRFKLRRHGAHEFVIDADPDVDDVARMLRIENIVRGVDENGDMESALSEGKQLLLRMVQERDLSIQEIRLGAQELTVLFALILHGSSVAAAVIEAITAGAQEHASGEDADGELDLDGEPGEGERVDPGPLASERPSPEPSSSSDESEAGLLAIGTA